MSNKPTPKGKIDDNFKKRLNDLREKANKMCENVKTPSTPRAWHTPTEMTTNILDVANLHEPCWNRDKLNQLYSDEVLAVESKKGGVVSDLTGLKRQINFMAVEERAWRLRHASKARCMVVSHGRLEGHGQQGGIFTMVSNEIENIFLRGAAAQQTK